MMSQYSTLSSNAVSSEPNAYVDQYRLIASMGGSIFMIKSATRVARLCLVALIVSAGLTVFRRY
ncbi:MAG: hypothetical protein JWQ64_637 [Subtercola sp.]|nr:hypothetical protein [Subtercola sp.]